MREYGPYIDATSTRIEASVEEMRCQPVLFIGSGISKRYFDAPNWRELLEEMASRCPEIDQDLEYYFQKGNTEEEVATILAEAYYEWAWSDGRSRFPDKLYDDEKYDEEIYLKYEVSKYFKDITPDSIEELSDEHQQEIERLQEIQPHSIITTNYDGFLELIFPDYEPVIGEEVLKEPHQSIGEIFKIHGSVERPEGLVLTKDDYKQYDDARKYLTAKLLTYFAEHPVLIAGYGIGDENVKKILADIDHILAPDDGLVENIYFVKWVRQISEVEIFENERRFDTVEGGSILLNYVMANGFDWVFNSFGSGGAIEGVNLKLLRTVLANTYEVVASKAPKEEVKIDYRNLKRAADSEDVLGTMFGVTMLENPPDVNLMYRFGLSEVADRLGYDHWTPANQLIEQIESETGHNIKETDNVYHIDTAFGKKYPRHRYSEAAIELLRKVKNAEEYELEITERDVPVESEPQSGAEADD